MSRVSNFLLGGDANWEVDREFARQAVDLFPLLAGAVVANHRFLVRTVRHLAKSGIRQFVDLGGGVLAMENTHQVADRVVSDCRVAYVESDPVAFAHAEILLDEDGDPDRHTVVHADPGQPEELWARLCDTWVIDTDEPIAFLMASAMDGFQIWRCDGELGAKVVIRYRELLPVGSYVAISHLTRDGVPPEIVDQVGQVARLCRCSYDSELTWRSRTETAALLGDFEIVDPGVVWTAQWRPDEPTVIATPSQSVMLAAVGRKVRA